MIKEIFIIDNREEMLHQMNYIFQNEKEYQFKRVNSNELDIVLKNIPSVIIINENNIDMDVLEICDRIRHDDDNIITPIIVCSSNRELGHSLDVLKRSVEYYLIHPIDKDYLYYIIKNVIRFMDMNRRVSPLTGLPGNVQIHAEMRKRLLNKEDFTVLYFDLDNFKAYNDIYGFLKGDEVIKFTAKVIIENIHAENCAKCFVGHIGGDDFVAILNSNIDYEKICKNIINDFDTKILDYFSDIDRDRGYVEVANRRNEIEKFPLTSISIGVVDVRNKKFHNILEIGEMGAQVKHLAKITPGSTYAVNKRK